MTKPDDDMAKLVAMQQHRDAWRGYAYGTRQKPQDFLDGNMVDRQPTVQETQSLELSRVRGLLQRYGRHIGSCRYTFPDADPCTCGFGAESADIGKLDSAARELTTAEWTEIMSSDHIDEQTQDVAGSAETAGEKAAPHQQTVFVVTGEYSQSAYFNRASAERHIAERKEPGHHQIHEYRLAEPREPEKLNNAQNAEGK